ncbi:MAG: hypothetical protein J1E85_01695 [Ruminococcus sp.]|nr:hypothetical protein [Ruminococcus sp.]
MKRIKPFISILIFIISICIVGTSCSQNNYSVYAISYKETEKHFYQYENKLKDYGEINANWYGTSGSIFIYPNNSKASVDFHLYNLFPDTLFSTQKNTDYGYERYWINSYKDHVAEDEVCNFEGAYGSLLSLLLSGVTGRDISAEFIEERFEKAVIEKESLFVDKIDSSVLIEQVLYDEEIYINKIWCNYYLSYYSVPNKFVEKITFGGMDHNDYVNLQVYE